MPSTRDLRAPDSDTRFRVVSGWRQALGIAPDGDFLGKFAGYPLGQHPVIAEQELRYSSFLFQLIQDSHDIFSFQSAVHRLFLDMMPGRDPTRAPASR